MRTCSKCAQTKELEDFMINKQCKEGRTFVCKLCNRERWAPYYKANRETRKADENRKNRSRKDLIVNKYGSMCFDCKQTFPSCVFDFHHLDPTIKDIQISKIRTVNETLWKELEKCVMLCSNCHRIRHMNLSKGGKDATVN